MNSSLLKRSGLAALMAVSMVTSCLQAQAAPPAGYENVKPVFSEEFNASKLDTTKWITTYPFEMRSNPGNAELEYYVDNAFTFVNGACKIKADKKSTNGFPYTSGILTSYGKYSQQYGYFEMRAQLPKGKGMWPAFWLLPVSTAWPPEIDIMEVLGDNPKTTYMTLHFNNSTNQEDSSGGVYTSAGGDYSTSYHTFGVDWRPGSLTWYVDGIKRYQVTKNVPSDKMYILANLAVGGTWPGSPNASTVFPNYMVIDYIRAWPYTGK